MSIFSFFFKDCKYPNQKTIGLYRELKQITHLQHLQNTTHRYHHIPYNHIRQTKYIFDLKTTLKLKIDSYFMNTLSSSHSNNWHNRGGTITQKINHFGLNPNHWQYVEHTRKKPISCIEQGIKYIGINLTKNMVDLTFYLLLIE